MKSKSNPRGIRKGHWVTRDIFICAYRVSRVKNGKIYIISPYQFPKNWRGNQIKLWTRVNPKTTKKILARC